MINTNDADETVVFLLTCGIIYIINVIHMYNIPYIYLCNQAI